MAVTQRRPDDRTAQPPGVEGDGMDPYPTYRDGPVTPHRATATKPTDVALPRSRRTYAFPILIGLAVFALIIVMRIAWGGINMAADGDMAPGEAASPPAATAPATQERPPAAATP